MIRIIIVLTEATRIPKGILYAVLLLIMLVEQPPFAGTEHIAIAKVGKELAQDTVGLHDGFNKNIRSTKGDNMKQLVCEMCGGKDLVKQDSVFVCQNCQAKYSVEEFMKMIAKIDSSAKLNVHDFIIQ